MVVGEDQQKVGFFRGGSAMKARQQGKEGKAGQDRCSHFFGDGGRFFRVSVV
jgi:hypothetical protein